MKDDIHDPGFQSKLAQLPYLKPLLTLTHEEPAREIEPKQKGVRETVPRTHLPVENAKTIHDHHFEELGSREDKELFSQEHGLSNAYEKETGMSALMQHHKAKDPTMVEKSYDYRLKTTTVQENIE